MNAIRESLSKIRATEDLKKNTLQYLLTQQKKQRGPKSHPALKYALTAACLFLLLGAGGYSVYRQPVSFISIDVNPSVELGINRFGRVVSAEAYNADGQELLKHLSLKNIPYVQAIDKLLAAETSSGFLKEDSLLVFTVISAHCHSMIEELSATGFSQSYETLMYAGDASCMEEAHSHEMSFGRYRVYQELTQYDDSVTVEDCHNMTMEQIYNRLESCAEHQGGNGSQHHGGAPAGTSVPGQACTPEPAGSGHHGKHGDHHE